MSKRRADKQLTQDNWDANDSGGSDTDVSSAQPQIASQEVISGRVIKKARRRINRDSSQEKPASSPFAMFSGFGVANSTSKASGLAVSSTSAGSQFTSGNSSKTQSSSDSGPATDNPFAFLASLGSSSGGSGAMQVSSASDSSTKLSAIPSSQTSDKRSDDSLSTDSAVYQKQLRALNECVLRWIEQHVRQNPYCLLTPVFDDYGKHLASIRANADKTPVSSAKPKSPEAVTTLAKTAPFSGFGSPALPMFSFGGGGVSATTPLSSTAADAKNSSGFGAGFFGFQKQPSGNDEKAVADDDNDEQPPVPVVSVVEETDSLYSKRCKLFYKKDGCFVEKGVGMLHLKPCADDKIQLLIRADTNLGNVLLNIKLNKSIPTQRMGKNNVMMACVPNPPLDPKSTGDSNSSAVVPLLLRVKSSEDADQLLSKLDEFKQRC